MASTNLAPLPSIQPAVRQRWVDLGLILLIGFVPLIFTAVYTLFFPVQAADASTNFRFLGGLIHEVSVLTLFYCLFKRQGRSLKDIGLSPQWVDIPKALGLTVLAWIAVLLFWGVISVWSLNVIGSPPHLRDPRVIFGSASMSLMIAYSFGSAIFEETLVRGYLMTELIDFRWPVWLAGVASFILQTSYHLYYGFAGAILVSGIFAVSTIYFAKSRRLMPVVLSHLLWDVAASLLNR